MLGAAPRAERSAPLAAFAFLLGTWDAVGDAIGTTGGFTFAPAVQDRVIVRKNYSNTPASGDKPASRHDDLMTISTAKATSYAWTARKVGPPAR